ncbi:ComF family protein [Halomonas sp. M4R5S39]|uniref:ComF family protein n=1 Tax=Halomonas kalidii TaxID=3043293 RepID=UPI0024A8A244|nr:ComF family protein [Halomonas kalidii]MDI5987123.1 ComF family protein [Halomonas kalidii]
MSTAWIDLVDGALRRALPGRCAFCLAPGSDGHPWCEACFASLSWNLPACPCCAEPQPGQLAGRRCGACLRLPPAYDRARVPLRYEGEVAGLVRRFKFHASPRAGAVLLDLLTAGLPAEALAWPAAVVPVPLHPRRARERGFDQAGWLARRLARRSGRPLIEAERRRDTRSQRGLDRRERRANLRGAFRVEAALPSGVVLVDDVMTTGATLDALAAACRRAGAERVEVWAVARTPLHLHL